MNLVQLVENKDYNGFKDSMETMVESILLKLFKEDKDRIVQQSKIKEEDESQDQNGQKDKLDEAVKIDIDFAGDNSDIKDVEKKYRVKFTAHRTGYFLSGDKNNVKKYILSKDFGMDKEDAEDLYPELF